jgi:hypothetical protein
MDQKRIIPGSVCNCSTQRQRVTLDLKGHHVASGCRLDGVRQATHDGVKYEIAGIINYSGGRTKIEERGCFAATDPSSQMRPDISVRNPPDGGSELLLDVCVTSPLPGVGNGNLSNSSLNLTAAVDVGRAARTKFNNKNIKYKAIAEANQLTFLPIIFESTGRLHPESLQFFKDLAKYAEEEEKRINDKTVLFAYMMNRISCALQKNIARSIIRRLAVVNSHRDRDVARSYDTSHDFVSTHNHFYVNNRLITNTTED